MKRIDLLLVLVLVLVAGNVFAHDKGDLMLNIEPHLGAALPSRDPAIRAGMKVGVDFGLQTTVHYYFTDFFAINAGLGVDFAYHNFVTYENESMGKADILWLIPPLWPILLPISLFTRDEIKIGSLFSPYVTIPFGVRLSLGTFTIGAGASVHIPISISIEDELLENGTYEKEVAGDFGTTTTETYFLYVLPYMGWYVDIGFDASGAKGKKGGFGLLLRLSGSFGDTFKGEDWNNGKPLQLYEPRYDPNTGVLLNREQSVFNFFSATLLFQFAIEMANLPIGRR